MNPRDQRQRKLMDQVYGPPGLGEQAYFGAGGLGPRTESMEHQEHPFGREEDAFSHERPSKDKMWFVDSIDQDAGKASVMQGDRTMEMPLDILPEGAAEGRYLDADTGSFVDDPDQDVTRRKRQRLVGADDGGDIGL